ncbi:MAG TPA: S41 family peptidase [Pyrinomonadaceae bacterium]|nr:S41 family peptidase [Pyrinomonadaceae bacterium]
MKFLFLFFLMLVWLASLSTDGISQTPNNQPPDIAIDAATRIEDRIKVFERVWQAVNDKYFDASFNGVDWNAARERYRSSIGGLKSDEEFYALLNQMLGELRDAHTLFRTPRQVEASKRQQATSVGFSIRVIEEVPVIFSVDNDSDAARAGVESGMRVRTINGQPFAERFAQAQREISASSSERLRLLRVYARLVAGKPDTPLKLGLTRADGTAFEVTLIRRTVSNASPLTSYLLPSGLAYIKFNAFRDGTAKEVKAALEKFKDAPGLIVDLRGNGGGDVQEMLQIADYFLNSKVFFGGGVTRSGKPLSFLGGLVRVPLEVYAGGSGKPIYSKPIAILTSERTGSAAESFTAGMQENNRAWVVGSQSCGCVNVVNNQISVKGGELQISELGYLSSKGRKLEGVGVTPDKAVVITLADLRSRRDASIEEAENFLKNTAKR